MDKIFTRYLELLEVVGSAPQTVNNNHRSFELVTEFFDWRGIDASSAQTSDLVPWVRELSARYEASTVSRHIYCVNAAYKHASETGILIRNPMVYLTKLAPKAIDKLPEILTCDQIRDIHGLVETPREMMIFHLLLWTGCRAFELRPLRWEQANTSYVDFDNDQLIIFGKGGKIRMVPLHPILRAKLDAWPQTGRAVLESNQRRELSGTQWGVEVKGMMDRAGVHTEKRSHIFRKSLNTNLLRNGVPEHVLDALFGWAPTSVRTKHYTGVVREDVRQALLRAYAQDPVVPEQYSAASQATRPTLSLVPSREMQGPGGSDVSTSPSVSRAVTTKVASSLNGVPPIVNRSIGTKVTTSFNAVQLAPVQELRWNSSGGFHTKLP
jgi:site-specific recombinase XerD